MSRLYFDEDGNFTFPLTVGKITDVPIDMRPLYMAAGGQYMLDPEILPEAKEQADEIARLKQEIADVKADTEKTVQRLRAEADAAHANLALREAFTQAGVDPKLVLAATALIQTTYRFETEDSDNGGAPVVVASDAFGLHSPQRAVERWLASPPGEPFRSKSALVDEGHFMGLLAQLRQER